MFIELWNRKFITFLNRFFLNVILCAKVKLIKALQNPEKLPVTVFARLIFFLNVIKLTLVFESTLSQRSPPSRYLITASLKILNGFLLGIHITKRIN